MDGKVKATKVLKPKKDEEFIGTFGNFLRIYGVHYSNGAKWTIASRRELNEENVGFPDRADAINVLPYSVDENGKVTVYLIRELRYPFSEDIYSLPAGITTDKDQSEGQTLIDELREEIGGEIVGQPVKVFDRLPTSAGLTNETMSFYEVEVKITGKQHLEKNEKIKLIPVGLEKVEEMLSDPTKHFDVKGAWQIREFMARQKVITLEKQVEELTQQLKNGKQDENVKEQTKPIKRVHGEVILK